MEYYKSDGGVALRTWQDYRYHIENNIIPYLGTIGLGNLKTRDVDLWKKALRDKGLGSRTAEYAQSVLRRALQFAVEWEILARNPAAARFRATKRKRAATNGAERIRFLDPDQARKFLEVIRGDRHEALYGLAITTGLRPVELYGLRWKDIDFDARRLTVNQVLAKTRRKKGENVPRFQFGPPKTDKSRRTSEVPKFVRDLLANEHDRFVELRALAGEGWSEQGLVFPSEVGTPLEERNVLRRFQNLCERNHLPKLRLYDLRHTHASLLIYQGVHPKKISERLGHSSIKLTMDTYGHLFEGSDRDSADRIERLFAPPKPQPTEAILRSRPRPRIVRKKAS